MKYVSALTAAALVAWGIPIAFAADQTLRIGLSSEPNSLDPHFNNQYANKSVALYQYEPLVRLDGEFRPIASLASSWKLVDETTWEFKLRPGIKFSNGTPFTANDFVYSICRIPTLDKSPSPFTLYTKGIAGIEAPDAETIRITTPGAYPMLPIDLSFISVVSAKAGGVRGAVIFKSPACDGMPEDANSVAFDKPGESAGTGPYTLKEWSRGNAITFDRNDGYWGDKPAWASIVLRNLPVEGTRVASLLSGDVDIIENVPLQDVEGIKGRSEFHVVSKLTDRTIMIHLDQGLAPSPAIKPTDKNPLQDRKVREALSLAIDRDAIATRIMRDFAQPVAQTMPAPFFGADPTRKPQAADPGRARQLLAEAGYPAGFEITLAAPNDRYVNDDQIAQAVAQMWTRIGIKTNVDAMPGTTFFARRNQMEFSAFLVGWGGIGDMASSLTGMLATPNKEKGFGPNNKSRYSNPQLDAVLIESSRTVDEEARAALLRKASGIAMDDYAALPVHAEMGVWATKASIEFAPRSDYYTLGFLAKPVQ